MDAEPIIAAPGVRRTGIPATVGRCAGPRSGVVRADAFGPGDVALVRVLAEHAGGAIGRVELIGALGRSRRVLARRIEVERTLRDIAAELTGARDDRDVLQRTADAAASLLRATSAWIDLFEERDGELHWSEDATTRDHPDVPDAPPGGPHRGEGISGRAIALGRPFRTGAYLEDRRFVHLPRTDGWIREHGIRSAACCAIRAGDAVLGLLTAFSTESDTFDEDDDDVLVALSDRVAIALSDPVPRGACSLRHAHGHRTWSIARDHGTRSTQSREADGLPGPPSLADGPREARRLEHNADLGVGHGRPLVVGDHRHLCQAIPGDHASYPAGGSDARPAPWPPGRRRATGGPDPPAGGDGHEALA